MGGEEGRMGGEAEVRIRARKWEGQDADMDEE